MGAVVVLASHAGDEILGAGRAMAEALACGERIGIIVLAQDCPSGMAEGGAPGARITHVIDCQAALQALLGEVPPLLMLSLSPSGLDMQGQHDLGETALLGGFLHSISAATLLVTNPGYRDGPYKAALQLAEHIMTQGLAEHLMVAAPDGGGPCASAGGMPADNALLAEIRDNPPGVICCERGELRFAAGEPAWWDFTVRADEAAHYCGIVAALADKWYPEILELGCGTGMLTPVLAAHSNRLVTFDASQAALNDAHMRVGGTFNVELQRGALPCDLPAGAFDLILLNDCLDDLEYDALAQLAQALPLIANHGCRMIVAARQDGAASQLAAGLLIGQLAGWEIMASGCGGNSGIQVLERA